MKLDSSFALSLCTIGSAALLTACGLGGSSDLGDDRAAGEIGGSSGTPQTDPGGAGGFSAGGDGPAAGGYGEVPAGAGSGGTSAGGTGMGGEAGSISAGGNAMGGGSATACGDTVCALGQVCCNESCGICTPPGGVCTQQLCGANEPDAGAIDCSGITALCIEGTVWSVDDCACVPAKPCGDTFCTGTDFCCNDSCGICAPEGGACTQQICEPAPSACESDQDCQLVDNYCGGCKCLGLTDPTEAPTCADPIACFAAPCEGKSVSCVSGSCVVSP